MRIAQSPSGPVDNLLTCGFKWDSVGRQEQTVPAAGTFPSSR